MAAAALLAMLAFGASADEKSSGAPGNPDPFESVNRKVYAFNDFADRNFLKPVAKGYHWITPQFMQDGVHNVFQNVGEVGNILNSLLQAKFKYTATGASRLLINSTIGIFGIFDVAGRCGIERHEEDFGQTLGYWGVGPGPFLEVPFLGPRSLRDGFGSVADAYSDALPYLVTHVPTRNELYGGRVIDSRTQLLDAEELVSGDRYIFIRDAYLQRREFMVHDGEVQDSFGNDDYSEPESSPAPAQPEPQAPAN